jgi:hypothetical protein
LIFKFYSIFSFMCKFCRSLFVLLYFFFWSLYCLFFDIRILITPLVSSNSSYKTLHRKLKMEQYLKTMLGSSLLLFVMSGIHVLLMLFAFIYAYWCPIRFPFLIMFVSFNSNTTDGTWRAGTKNTKTCNLTNIKNTYSYG